MPILLTDPVEEKRLLDQRKRGRADRWNEVWDGLLVVPAMPDIEHQEIQGNISVPFTLVGLPGVRPGVNVSDRHEDWLENHRCPDIVVYLPDNNATNHETHYCGGPDFLVEIISPGDLAWDKLEFYAKVQTREVLIVDRDPWRLELYQLNEGVLKPAGVSDLANPAILTSRVLPFTFQLREGTKRPSIQLVHAATGQVWTA